MVSKEEDVIVITCMLLLQQKRFSDNQNRREKSKKTSGELFRSSDNGSLPITPFGIEKGFLDCFYNSWKKIPFGRHFEPLESYIFSPRFLWEKSEKKPPFFVWKLGRKNLKEKRKQ